MLRTIVIRLTIVAGLIVCGIGSGTGWAAQESHVDDDVYALGEIVVTEDGQGPEGVGTVREITAAEIEERGARTLDEAIALLPGVVVRTGAQGVPRVDIRGFRSRHIVLLLNGIPMNPSYDGQFDPTFIPVENIAMIKVSYGNASVLYGDNGLAGVINIITKKGRKGLHGSIGGEVGQGERNRGEVTVSAGDDNVALFVGASMMDQKGYELSGDFDASEHEDGDLRENSDKRNENVFANLGMFPSDSFQMGMTINYIKAAYGIPPTTIDDTMDPEFGSSLKYERMDDTHGLSGQISAAYDDGGPFDMRGWLFISSLEEESNGYDSTYREIGPEGTYFLESDTDIFGTTLQAGYDLDRAGNLAFSLSGRQEKYLASGESYKRNNRFDSLDNNQHLEVYFAGAEYSVETAGHFGAVLGYTHLWLDKNEADQDDEGSYLMGVYYDVAPTTRLSGSIARKVRFPTIRQLYGDGANPDLLPETANNIEIGIEQTLPADSLLSVTGYYIDVNNYIEKDSSRTFQNNSSYLFQGIEVAGETRFIDNLMLRVTYTYLNSKDYSPGTTKDELQKRPENKFTFEGRYAFDFGLTAYGSLMFLSNQYDYGDTGIQYKLDDITVLNVKLDQAVWKNRFHLYVGVDNLLDDDYNEGIGYPAPGRYVYGGCKFRF